MKICDPLNSVMNMASAKFDFCSLFTEIHESSTDSYLRLLQIIEYQTAPRAAQLCKSKGGIWILTRVSISRLPNVGGTDTSSIPSAL